MTNSAIPIEATTVASTQLQTRPPAETLRRATAALAVLVGFSIPVSTSLAEISTGLFMLCWVLSGDFARKWEIIRRNRVALFSLVLFGVMVGGVTYSTAGWVEAARCLVKYREFVYLPMFVVVFRDERLRRLGTRAFAAGLLIVLGLSYCEWLSGADFGLKSDPHDFVIAKDRIIHSIMMALLAYISALEFARGRESRWMHGAIIALAVPNVLFLVQGRTGYLLVAVLTTLFLYQRLGKRGLAYASVIVAVGGWGAYLVSSSLQHRVQFTLTQLYNQFGPEKKPWWDPRLEYYENTLALIRRHPLAGTGTGSFSHEYAQFSAAQGLSTTTDPHNEYLHLAVQLGIPGAALFLLLLAVQWRGSRRLPEWEMQIARGVVLTIGVGCLFNSLILSITGGLIWSYFGGLAFAGLSTSPGAPGKSSETPTAPSTTPANPARIAA